MKKPAFSKEKPAKDLLSEAKKKSMSKVSEAKSKSLVTATASDSAGVRALEIPVQSIPEPKVDITPVLGIIVGFAAIFYALMLISYNAGDPSFSNAASHLVPKNLIGLCGAWISDIALFTFGWSAYWLIPVMLVWAWRIFSKNYIPRPFSRLGHLGAFLLLMASSSSLEALRFYPYAKFLPGDAGGVLGQAVLKSSLTFFGVVGFTLVALALLTWAMALYFDFSWVSLFETLGAKLDRLFKGTPRREKLIDAKPQSEPQDLAKTLKPVLPPTEPTKSAPEIKISKQAEVKPSKDGFDSQIGDLFGSEGKDRILPDLKLFDPPGSREPSIDPASLSVMSGMIESKLASFGVEVTVKSAHPGPVVTRYEIEPAEGVKSSSIKNLENDLARVLSVASVRVLETVPGTVHMGLEVPNPRRQIVKLSELLGSQDFAKLKGNLPLCLGKSITGEPFVQDLAKMPHLLVAGTTGSGKSVGVNAMILSLLYRFEPKDLRLILVDPKKVEFTWYEDIPHLLCPVVDQMMQAKNALQWCVKEMDRRYQLASFLKVRNLESYNQRVRAYCASGQTRLSHVMPNVKDDFDLETLPYIVVVVDEMADLLMVDKKGVEESLIRLAQKARAAGIHLILATQRPSADVLSGLLRTNIPSRAAFRVVTGADSRIILDQMGAENLLGWGDFLFKTPSHQVLERVQGPFVTDDELERVTSALRQMGKPKYVEDVTTSAEDLDGEGKDTPRLSGAKDPLFDKAVQIILDSNKCSVTFLQRRLGVGYPRAANIVDEMEAEGIVSPADSNGRRTINARNESLDF